LLYQLTYPAHDTYCKGDYYSTVWGILSYLLVYRGCEWSSDVLKHSTSFVKRN